MNDKDKEAFEKWWMEGFKGMSDMDVIKYKDSGKQTSLHGWQAACEYKQNEIDELKNVTYWQVEQDGKVTRHISIAEIEKLQAENAKLRECVEWYAYRKEWQENDNARQVLKELEDK